MAADLAGRHNFFSFQFNTTQCSFIQIGETIIFQPHFYIHFNIKSVFNGDFKLKWLSFHMNWNQLMRQMVNMAGPADLLRCGSSGPIIIKNF